MSVIFVSCSILKHTPKEQEEFMLDGKISRDDLKKNFKWFDQGYNNYHPNDTAVNKLKKYSAELSVTIVMGTWCGDSQDHIPEFFKVADSIGLSETQIEMIAVNRKKVSDSVDVSSYKIQNIPVFILFYKGKTIGRIIETPRESVEKDMLHFVEVMK